VNSSYEIIKEPSRPPLDRGSLHLQKSVINMMWLLLHDWSIIMISPGGLLLAPFPPICSLNFNFFKVTLENRKLELNLNVRNIFAMSHTYLRLSKFCNLFGGMLTNNKNTHKAFWKTKCRHFFFRNVGYCLSKLSPCTLPGKVEPSIIEHIPIIKHFPIFFTHSLTKLSDFCVIGCANWRVTNVLWVSEVKEW
jgi:hypothetical protein